jgi:hypothetical protein
MGKTRNKDSVPNTTRPRFDAVVALTDQVCSQHLTEEYATLARSLAAALARKRPCPLARGRINTWACGVMYAVGAANFLFDPAQTPHMRGADVCAAFGVSGSAGAAKGREIMRMFQIGQLDPQWCLPASSRTTRWRGSSKSTDSWLTRGILPGMCSRSSIDEV